MGANRTAITNAYSLSAGTLTDSGGDTTTVQQYSVASVLAALQSMADAADALATYDSVSDVQAATIDANLDVLMILGRTTPGIGAGAFRRVGSQPSHALYVQSADGAYFEYVPEVFAGQPFVKVSVAGDDAQIATTAAGVLGCDVLLDRPVQYSWAAGVTLPANVGMTAVPGARVVYTGTVGSLVAVANTSNRAVIAKYAGAYVKLGAFNAISEGDASIVFTADPGLVVGDRITVHNQANFSWTQNVANARDYYQKGNARRVVRIEGASPWRVWINKPFTHDFAYSLGVVEAFKWPQSRGHMVGLDIDANNLERAQSTTIYGLSLQNAAGFEIRDCTVTGVNYAALDLYRCMDFAVHNTRAATILDSRFDPATYASNNDYGCIVSNCAFGLFDNCQFSANWHAFSAGGGDGVGAIQNENILVRDCTGVTTFTVQGFDFHGNSEDCGFKGGSCNGGLTLGGRNVFADGVSIRNEGPSGRQTTILITDPYGDSIAITNCMIVTDKDAWTTEGKALIDIDTGAAGAYLQSSLKVRITGNHIIAPNESVMLSTWQTNAQEGIGISLEFDNVVEAGNLWRLTEHQADFRVLIDYDGQTSPIIVNDLILVSGGASGVVRAITDNGTTGTILVSKNNATPFADNAVIDISGGATGAAVVNGSEVNAVEQPMFYRVATTGAWGSDLIVTIAFDNLSGSPFARGDTITDGTSGATGKVLLVAGSTLTIRKDNSTAYGDNNQISNGATTADVNGAEVEVAPSFAEWGAGIVPETYEFPRQNGTVSDALASGWQSNTSSVFPFGRSYPASGPIRLTAALDQSHAAERDTFVSINGGGVTAATGQIKYDRATNSAGGTYSAGWVAEFSKNT